MNRVRYEYWKSAVVNQTAHALVGSTAMAHLHFTFGMEAWIALILTWLGAWVREFWQADWRILYALTRWRKHNDAMWFVIGGFLLLLVAS